MRFQAIWHGWLYIRCACLRSRLALSANLAFILTCVSVGYVCGFTKGTNAQLSFLHRFDGFFLFREGDVDDGSKFEIRHVVIRSDRILWWKTLTDVEQHPSEPCGAKLLYLATIPMSTFRMASVIFLIALLLAHMSFLSQIVLHKL